jgi:hypothetical protein
MFKYSEYLKNPLIAGSVSGLLVMIFAYIDKKMNDRDIEGSYYAKLFTIVFLLVAGLVYFTSSDGKIKISKQEGGSYVVKKITDTGLDVYTDVPDF